MRERALALEKAPERCVLRSLVRTDRGLGRGPQIRPLPKENGHLAPNRTDLTPVALNDQLIACPTALVDPAREVALRLVPGRPPLSDPGP